MNITICGSLAFEDRMHDIKRELETAGHVVEVPFAEEGADTDPLVRKELIDDYFAKIDVSDIVLVVNESKNGTANYIGGNVLMEMTYAYTQNVPIFLLNPVPDVSYAIEIKALQPTILNGGLAQLNTYVGTLPVVHMSTESPVKHLAVRRGLRKAGIHVRVTGTKVESGVNEQPMTIDETYDGAETRHRNLKNLAIKADYYATIESGQHPAHKDHSLFGCAVIIIEKASGERKTGINLDVEFPQEMLDKVPSQYPDLGVLVQKEYGSKLKDPYPFFTNNKVTRAEILEHAVYNTAVQLDEGENV